MEQEIITPDPQPKGTSQALSPVGSLIAAAGATLMIFSMTGSAMLATVWAFSKLFGFPDFVMYGFMALGAIPVLWGTIWTAGRAWHVEKLLSTGQNVDVPVFNLTHYLRKG
jgi:hypothetical protein